MALVKKYQITTNVSPENISDDCVWKQKPLGVCISISMRYRARSHSHSQKHIVIKSLRSKMISCRAIHVNIELRYNKGYPCRFIYR